MKAKERNRLWDLCSITNKMGGRADYTAISPIAMMKYKEALGKVSKVISLIITEEDEEQCQRYINELDALSRWNFGDRNGRISEEEKQVNERIKQIMGGWTPMSD
jgi:hypothetical protein